MIFLTLLIIPLLVCACGFYFLKTITLQEFLIQCVAQIIVAGVSTFAVLYANTTDTEVINSVVAKKYQSIVSCSHSYECFCTYHESCSGSGKDRTCSTVKTCQTCYEHSHDYNWDVKAKNGNVISINRIDRQGIHEPQRWSSVQVGDPMSWTHSYTNYIKASPDSLFAYKENK